VRDVAAQAERLVYPGFVAATPAQWRPRLAAFLDAAGRRLDKLPGRLDRDQRAMKAVAHWETVCARLAEAGEPGAAELRWMLEEYRVSLFAQETGTSVSVSDRRLAALVQEVRAMAGSARGNP